MPIGPPVTDTPQHIELRPWRESDVPALIAIFAASDDLSSQYPDPVTDAGSARGCMDRMLGWDERRRNFAITLSGVAVGNIGLSTIERRHSTGWISYFSSGGVRGQGLVTRSTTAVANWALSDSGLFRLQLGHRANNPASGAVALTAGFQIEGRERQKLQYGDRRFDTVTYGRLATDPAPAVENVTLDADG